MCYTVFEHFSVFQSLCNCVTPLSMRVSFCIYAFVFHCVFRTLTSHVCVYVSRSVYRFVYAGVCVWLYILYMCVCLCMCVSLNIYTYFTEHICICVSLCINYVFQSLFTSDWVHRYACFSVYVTVQIPNCVYTYVSQ